MAGPATSDPWWIDLVKQCGALLFGGLLGWIGHAYKSRKSDKADKLRQREECREHCVIVIADYRAAIDSYVDANLRAIEDFVKKIAPLRRGDSADLHKRRGVLVAALENAKVHFGNNVNSLIADYFEAPEIDYGDNAFSTDRLKVELLAALEENNLEYRLHGLREKWRGLVASQNTWLLLDTITNAMHSEIAAKH